MALLAALSTTAFAQSAIVGVVRDTSGAILPGVSVEATSEALIEKTRSAISDGNGQYRIIDLRPGSYVVTFTLPGFQTIKRDGIDLPSEFTATVSVEMKIGSLEETIVVTGASPMVDVQTAAHVQVLDRDFIDNLPTGRTIQGLGQMIVGVSLSLPDVGGSRAAMQTYMSVRGNAAANNTVLVDGMVVNGLESNGAVQSYFNDAMSQEMSYQTAGIDASVSSGGVKLNMIPKEGGNRFSGSTQVSYRPGQWQGDNFTDRLKVAGLPNTNVTDYIFDLSGAQGGPIMKNKIWFFATGRDYRTNNGVAGTKFDDGKQGKDFNYIRDALGRVTYQLSSKNKIAGYYDRVSKFRGHDMQSLTDPETASLIWTSPNYSTGQIKLTSTATSRLLFEGGWAFNIERRDTNPQEGIAAERWSDAWYRNVSITQQGSTLGGVTGAPATYGSEWPDRYSFNGSASYVSGAHHIKAGINGTYGQFRHTVQANGDLQALFTNSDTSAYTASGGPLKFSNPVAVIVRNTPRVSQEVLSRDFGIYAQDTWTLRRMTVNAGIRWETLVGGLTATAVPNGRFVPARQAVDATDLPNWSDIAPRFQIVYDVFGNSKTAIKYSANRYNAAQTTSIAAAANPLAARTMSLPWNDVNGDGIPQGARFDANGTRLADCAFPSVGCEINFATLPSNFGELSDITPYGGFPRQYSLEQGFEIQHEVMSKLSVTGSYYYGNFKNLTTTLNRNLCGVVTGCAATAAVPGGVPYDWTPFEIFNPIDGTKFTVYNQATAARATDNITFVDPDRKDIFNSYSAEFRLRAGRGVNVFGGLSLERERLNGSTSTSNCTVGRLQDPNLLRFCDEFNLENGQKIPYNKNLRLNGSYALPWQGIMLSATLQSNQGSAQAQTYTISNSTTTPTRYPDGSSSYLAAGVPVPACPSPCPAGAGILSTAGVTLRQATLTPRLRPSNVVRGERLNQVDLKVSKTFKMGRTTINPNFEAFNLNNTDKVITYASTSYALSGGTYLRPNSVVQGRVLGVGASVKW